MWEPVQVGEISVMRMSTLQSFMSGRQKFFVVIVKHNSIATCFAIILLFRLLPSSSRGKHDVHPLLTLPEKLQATHSARKKMFTMNGI